jgi:hypothetical protein
MASRGMAGLRGGRRRLTESIAAANIGFRMADDAHAGINRVLILALPTFSKWKDGLANVELFVASLHREIRSI